MAVLQSNRINFLRRTMEDPQREARQRHNLALILCVAAVVLAFAAAESWYMYRIYYELTPQIEELNTYVEDADILAEYDSAIGLQNRLSALEYERDNLNAAVETVNSYPEFTKTLYDKVQAAAGESVNFKMMSYDRAAGLLTLDCNAAQMRSVPAFVTALKKTSIFGDDVQYYGEAWQTGSGYQFTVYCTVQKGA